MEIYLFKLLSTLITIDFCASLFLFYRVLEKQKQTNETLARLVPMMSHAISSTKSIHEYLLTDYTEKQDYNSNKIDEIAIDFERHLLALREQLETTKPMKPNNWDSVKAAFKGPTRVEINERD